MVNKSSKSPKMANNSNVLPGTEAKCLISDESIAWKPDQIQNLEIIRYVLMANAIHGEITGGIEVEKL